ncbi:MAG: thermonuclease family protein [bacterium]|nr:thermonuclease family protein [bacterium]
MKKTIIMVLLLFFSSCSISQEFQGPYVVHEVIDGDTLDIDLGRIRLSGINTPETGECYYEEAKKKLKEMTLYQEIFLEGDLTDYDKYGRMLRYIYTNTSFVNAEMVAGGYARVYDKYNESTKYYYELKELEKIAQENKLGIWSCTSLQEDCLYVASKNSNLYHKPECKWAKRIKAENLICFHSEEELEGYKAGSSC